MATKRVTLDLDPELYERLRKAAYDRHVSMSDIAREALESALPRSQSKEDDGGD
jgi:predicted transcriptional regulator